MSKRVIVIGAGVGGLSAALRLAHQGCDVTVIDMHDAPGGKMRVLPSAAGPVDAGPTVLTLRGALDSLFEDVGTTLDAELTLHPLATLARHYWDDGTMLDLMADQQASAANIETVFGTQAAQEFKRFSAHARRLFSAFDAPMMRTADPDPWALTRHLLRHPRLIRDMAPHRTLGGLLARSFSEPKLTQLFSRYATYVGGMPHATPALLALIWQAEAQGVWTVQGGMHQLALTLARLAEDRGARFRYQTRATRITRQGGHITGVETPGGHIDGDLVVFNGDPRALQTGLLGPGFCDLIPAKATAPRSLSAYVQAFAAVPHGTPLAHHTVFFGHDPRAEFDALAQDQMPTDATLYLCAQDHGQTAPDTPQRFEVIMNAPPVLRDPHKEKPQCQTLIFDRFRQFGLQFSPQPEPDSLTIPAGFDALFPASQGSLYGRSPQGLMAAFQRPTARTAMPGLYLCGGGTHPGPGVPMAVISGQHAAAAIMTDLASTSPSRQTAMPGGMSTGSARTAKGQSLSSGS